MTRNGSCTCCARPIIARTRPADGWVDARAPDGVTILAPFEQPQPDEYPGVRTGAAPQATSLFDLETDPAEQHDVAAQNAEVVARLKRDSTRW